MVPHIEMVPVASIDPNPYRDLSTYPWIETKISSLRHSFNDVGFWTSITGRRKGNRIEQAFGHHRVEAARRSGIREIPIIVEDLSDEQMVKMMARENAEDYGTDFLVQLNTWDGGIQFLSSGGSKKPEALEIARLLGMTTEDDKGKLGDRINSVAQACNAAHALIHAGHITRDDLRGLTTTAARELTGQMLSQMERVEKMAKVSHAKVGNISEAKRYIAKAGKVTAKGIREGTVAKRDIRAKVHANAFSEAAKARNVSTPILAVFAQALARSISRMLHEDASAGHLHQIVKTMELITLEEDFDALRHVQFELDQLSDRAKRWERKLTPKREKVVELKKLEDRR